MIQNRSASHPIKKAVIVFSATLLLLTILLSSFNARKATDDVWKILGITKQAGDEKIKNSFMYGYLYYYGVKNVKNLAVNDRGAIANNLLTYTKQYVSTDAFKRDYEQMRKNAKPQEPVSKPLRTIEQIQKDEIARTEKSIKDTEKNMKDMPQYAKSMEPMLAILKDNLKKYQDPKNSYFASVFMGEKYDNESQIKSFNESMKQWESAYPETVSQFIITRLQKMLDATKDINYNAELVEKWGRKRFVNPAYEAKNTEWKQGFRAGKEITENSRAFAQKWLEELMTKD
ncbi:MAG TPA: hypothetical protein VE933_11830 [Chitinophagaceae bacterium]|nr:hypothetical protein [Chitinophagaceae bacterium]